MIVCVEGNIGSGKTTVLKLLDEYETVPEPLHIWGGILEKFYADPASWSLCLHLRILHEFWKIDRKETKVIERSPGACRHVFGQLSYNDAHLTPAAWDTFKEYHDILGWHPDIYVFIDTPVDVCKARIEARKSADHDVSDEYLRRIEFQYHNFLKFCEVPVVYIDGTLPSTDIAQRIRQVIQSTLS